MEDELDFEQIEEELNEYHETDFGAEEEQPVEKELLRVKSLILLAIFVLPTLLIVIEVLTGGVSGAISPAQTQPPPEFPSVIF
jgi:hypothetical protein